MEPAGYMTFDGTRFHREPFSRNVFDDDANRTVVTQGAIDAPLPDGHVVVRFVGHGDRELPLDALIVREGELWHMPQAEAEQRSDVVIERQKPSKPVKVVADDAPPVAE